MSLPLWSIILAAGSGSRLGAERPKQYLALGGKPVFLHSLETFARFADPERLLLVHPSGDAALVESILASYPVIKPRLVEGGASRQASVAAALGAIEDEDAWVAVHDAARPLFKGEVLGAWREELEKMGERAALLPVLPVSDTLFGLDRGALVERIDRDRLSSVQTPQAFHIALLREAHAAAANRGEGEASDDGGLVLALGIQPRTVQGDPDNFKVTTAADLVRAESLLSAAGAPQAEHSPTGCYPARSPSLSGIGYDSHRFDRERPLILGGVTVESELGGLAGHSDADVLTHALMDALLGAAGLGDIGTHFSDTDPAYAGADSMVLLGRVRGLLSERGYVARNIDATVIAEKPRLAEVIPAMRATLAAALSLPVERVSVKATTNEGMGWIGRREGIAAMAIATLDPLS